MQTLTPNLNMRISPEQWFMVSALIVNGGNYVYNLFALKLVALDYNIESALGLKDIFVASGLNLVFGKINDFNNASRIGIVKTNGMKEFYGGVGLNYKRVLHNTIIQGDLKFDDTRFTTEITKNTLAAKAGIYYKSKRHLISLESHFLSKETPSSYGQIYGSLTYACHF